MLELNFEKIICRYFSGFFGYPLFYMISSSLEADETLFHVRHCGCDHVTLGKSFFCLLVSCHPWARGRYTRQTWERFCPILFATQRCVFMNSWPEVRKSPPHMQNLAALGCWKGRCRKQGTSLTQWVFLGVRGYFSLFFSFILSFVYCHACAEGWVLLKNLKPLCPESTQAVAQCSTVLAAEPFLYSLCTGQGFFHFMHHP